MSSVGGGPGSDLGGEPVRDTRPFGASKGAEERLRLRGIHLWLARSDDTIPKAISGEMNADRERRFSAPDEKHRRAQGAPSAREALSFKETLTHLGLRQLESRLRAAGDEVLLEQVEDEKTRRRTGTQDVEQIAKQVASLPYEDLLAVADRFYLESGPNQKAAYEVIWAELSSREAPPDPLLAVGF